MLVLGQCHGNAGCVSPRGSPSCQQAVSLPLAGDVAFRGGAGGCSEVGGKNGVGKELVATLATSF